MIDRHSNMHYQAGRQAFKEGMELADKPGEFLLGDWDAGWHDAHAETTRQLQAQAVKK